MERPETLLKSPDTPLDFIKRTKNFPENRFRGS